MAGVPGLEPRMAEPESAVLPITPYPIGTHNSWSGPTIPSPGTTPEQTTKDFAPLHHGPPAAAAYCDPDPAVPSTRTEAATPGAP